MGLYSLFSNAELLKLVSVFDTASNFERPVPEGFPKDSIVTSLSEDAKKFTLDLSEWFGQIQRAGQDALVMWS